MKAKVMFVCNECGYDSAKWAGKCPSCGAWNSMSEMAVEKPDVKSKGFTPSARNKNQPLRLSELESSNELRFSTGIGEFDRVLGGGAVEGSLTLIGGEPGIGKSTLLLQICRSLDAIGNVMYISGEESKGQLKLRADRLGITSDKLYILAETCLDDIFEAAKKVKPSVMVVDSIQTMYIEGNSSLAGNISQIRECTASLLQYAKSEGVTIFLIGHINKDGAIAGPKMLEHMVDCVLYFEGERHAAYRILRAAKNRFGSTNEIGVFEMRGSGLCEVPNPSAALLSGRPREVAGTCVTCIMEGSRPVLAEIQALVSKSAYAAPRRMAQGIDYNRAMLLLAVVEKRAGLYVGGLDAYINVIGGLKVDEPSADLAVVLALASSFKDKPLSGEDCVAFGEVGLTGELRPVSMLEKRLAEVSRMGIGCAIIPHQSLKGLHLPEELKIVRVKNVQAAIEACL